MSAVDRCVSDLVVGTHGSDGEADCLPETDLGAGLPTRYIDADTELLGQLAAMWQDFQQMRKAADQRGLSEKDVAVLKGAEDHFSRALSKALRQHTLWPWLSQYPGLGGVHTARLIARIGDPRRFPGQKCSLGHTFRPDDHDGCPFVDMETGERCPGELLPPREGPQNTGTRSLWHYLGLHVVNGRSPRKTKGQKGDWDPLGRTAVLQPDGIADAIVRNRVPKYRDLYDEKKARLQQTRGAETGAESEPEFGPAGLDGAEVDMSGESEPGGGLRPIQIDRIARKVAAKAFVADLLAEWKRLVGAAGSRESEYVLGPADPGVETGELLGRAAA